MLRGRWTLDRRIPVTIILAIVLQAAGALTWATSLDARVSRVEQMGQADEAMKEKFARLDERLDNLRQDIGDIKRDVRQLTNSLIGK